MRDYLINRHDNILDVLIQVGEAQSKSEAKMLFKSEVIFVTNRRVYSDEFEFEFVQTHRVNKRYDKYKGRCIGTHSAVMRVGGSWDPNNCVGGRMYNLIRKGSNPDELEIFR